jgi:SAM-dependent methyltransferase
VEAESGNPEYTRRLVELQQVWWKRILPVQAPYRWNLRRLKLGTTLDLGCGIGRNLEGLHDAVGLDYDADSVAFARSRGLEAYLPEEFAASARNRPGAFDSLLLSHVAEHLTPDELEAFVRHYVRCLRPGGKLVVICPQERGYASDATHREFVDFDAMRKLATRLDFDVRRLYSFPFPRSFGRLFVYNEFVMVASCREPSPAPAP